MASDPLLVAVVSPQPVVLHGLTDLLNRHPQRVRVVVFPDGVDPDVVLYDAVDLVDGDLSGLEEPARLDVGEGPRGQPGPAGQTSPPGPSRWERPAPSRSA